MTPEQRAAGWITRKAVQQGLLEKAEACERCGKKKKLLAHHDDYSKPLEVKWLCWGCHQHCHRGGWTSEEMAEMTKGLKTLYYNRERARRRARRHYRRHREEINTRRRAVYAERKQAAEAAERVLGAKGEESGEDQGQEAGHASGDRG
jgi:hypothetical protein